MTALASRVTRSDQPSFEVARRELRAALRRRRRALTPAERAAAAERVAEHVDSNLPLRAGQRIALYMALDEELDTAPLASLARSRGCHVYLPRIDDYRTRRLSFRRETATLTRNRFGILEPVGRETLSVRWLQVVFVPLVAFDARGMRLGMGAGFYDRALAFRLGRSAWRGPRLVGLAYAFQQVPEIPAEAHDVRLDAVATDHGVIRCSTGS